jgi:membrane protease YdiL (CAAX protease family)
LASRVFPPKEQHFTSQIMVLAVFFVISAVVSKVERIVVLPRTLPETRSILLGFLVLAGLVALMRPIWRRRVEERSRKVWLFMPRTPRERMLWITVALIAGIAEEVTYRGVMFTLLWRATGSALAAALLSASIFSISHFMQGWKSMAIIFAMALAFQGLAWTSGSLYVGMAVHALYDVVAGLFYGRYGDELGYPIEAMPPEASPEIA